jgi:glucosylceramidase
MSVRILLIVCVFLLSSCTNSRYRVAKWTMTNEKVQWEEQRNQQLTEYLSTDKISAEIRINEKQQVFDGFGACINEYGWSALLTLTRNKQNDILTSIFDPVEGLNFSICLMPIGANEYAKNYYSLNDSANDNLMQFLNLNRDKRYLIPYIKTVLKLNPDLKILGMPWTPPLWMKENKSYGSGTNSNSNIKPNNLPNQLIQNDTIMLAYALYFANYLKAYSDEDIKIEGIMVQNAINTNHAFPSCSWSASSLSNFIGNFLGPSFENQKIDAEIWLGSIENQYTAFADTIMGYEKCRKYIYGIGYQNADKEAICESNIKYPEVKKIQINNDPAIDDNNWGLSYNTFNNIKQSLNCGVNSFLFGNIILDGAYKNRWKVKQSSLITLHDRKRRVVYSPEYFVFKHFSLVQPGATKINVIGEFSNILAFMNPNKDLVIIAANDEDKNKEISIRIGNRIFKPVLIKKSLNTFLILNHGL